MKKNKFEVIGYKVINNQAGAWAYYEEASFKDAKELNDTKNLLLKTTGTISNIDSVWTSEEEAINRVQSLRKYYDEIIRIS